MIDENWLRNHGFKFQKVMIDGQPHYTGIHLEFCPERGVIVVQDK